MLAYADFFLFVRLYRRTLMRIRFSAETLRNEYKSLLVCNDDANQSSSNREG